MNRHLANGMLIILLASFTISAPLCAAASRYKEDEIKAVLIYHFTKFIDWPPTALNDATPEFTLCTFGTSPIESALATIRGKAVKGRPLVIRKISRPQQLKTCHTLFIRASALKSATQILAYAKDLPIITISDSAKFACMGGIFSFVRSDDTISFDVNPKAARRVGLTIRSKLLRLAKTIVRCN
ncbi:YfiR family protein [Candidatus Entotheonella palauensis]|uniref:YfiR family protein n=1 Tax=Candidatus Entotheonella palauensis TaxID=93172 RepID=UPI000B7F49A5|nr:YfiR family protein [Candidatus Entotheonella palauensis]